MPHFFERQRRTVTSVQMITMVGGLQREGEVVHVIVDHLADGGERLVRIGGMALPARTGRGDGVRHVGDPGWRPRDLYWPPHAAGTDLD